MSAPRRTDSSSSTAAANPALAFIKRQAKEAMKPGAAADDSDSSDSDSSGSDSSDSDSSDSSDDDEEKKPAKKARKEAPAAAAAASSAPKPKKTKPADDDDDAPKQKKSAPRTATATATEKKASNGIERSSTDSPFATVGEVFKHTFEEKQGAWKILSVGPAFHGSEQAYCPMRKSTRAPDYTVLSVKHFNFTAARLTVHGDAVEPNSEESFLQSDASTFHHLSKLDNARSAHNFDLVGAPIDPKVDAEGRTKQTQRMLKERKAALVRAFETANIVPNPEQTDLEYGPQPFVPWVMYHEFTKNHFKKPPSSSSSAAAAAAASMDDVSPPAAAAKAGSKRKSPAAASAYEPLNPKLEELVSELAAGEVAKLRTIFKGRAGSIAHAVDARFKPDQLLKVYVNGNGSDKEKEAAARAIAAFHPRGREILAELVARHRKEEEEEAEKIAAEMA